MKQRCEKISTNQSTENVYKALHVTTESEVHKTSNNINKAETNVISNNEQITCCYTAFSS